MDFLSLMRGLRLAFNSLLPGSTRVGIVQMPRACLFEHMMRSQGCVDSHVLPLKSSMLRTGDPDGEHGNYILLGYDKGRIVRGMMQQRVTSKAFEDI